MPEWGMLPIPTKLVKQGVRDMIRISDARMSRHQLRRLHPARLAGELRRRPACARQDRRQDHGRRAGPHDRLDISDAELAKRRAALVSRR